ncbi:hypothetical protein OGAPHI_000944 [Ogataea philodendri]|uniref:Small ribosomal subunit protein uS11m n=1 Tax=Ogataea philodendri TaxID=1378263 RepID=A0A9P8T9C4_9ASCO|nr:uncharacterized protein OGAPHI_000944 [Ogataea philodendri]KAH3670429.1 hypothetical protein OGAPHI_000944 [Ogataea philodendri]
MLRGCNRAWTGLGSVRAFSRVSALGQEPKSGATLGAILNQKPAQNKKKPTKLKLVKYVLHGFFRKNNSFLTLSKVEYDPAFEQKNPHLSFNEKVLYYLTLQEKTVYTLNTGTVGFRGAQRGEYEAGYQLASAFFRTIRERQYLKQDVNVEVVVKEFGKGRLAFFDALTGKEGMGIRERVSKLSDLTPVKIGGVQGPTPRRL